MNNLFSFATKELSQDAFLCWTINWMCEVPKGTSFYDMGKSVLSLFLGEHAFDEYEKVYVLRQYKHIDVLVLFEHDNQHYGLIIEDKTNTSEHSNQIQKYFEAVISDAELNINAENLYVAYVKTGILYDEDKRVKANIVTLEQLLNVLQPYVESTQSQILSDYVEYLNIEFIKRISIAKLINAMEVALPLKTEDYDNGKPLLATYYGQYLFLDTVFKMRNIEKRLDIRKSDSDRPYYEYLDSVYAGTNNDGTPWTQYCFWGEKYPTMLTDSKNWESHFLFWRIDKFVARGKNANKDPKYYIALRHYDSHAHSDKFAEANIRKENVYNQLRAVCDVIQKQNPDIISAIGNRAAYKESDLVFIPAENLKKIGNGTLSDVQSFLLEITKEVYAVAQNLVY